MSRMNLQHSFVGCNPTLRSKWGHWWRMTWLQPCDWLLEWTCGQQTPPVVDLEVKDRSNRGRDGWEDKEHDQGDKGPNNRARSKQLSSVLLQWTKEARRKASNNSNSRARAKDRGRSHHATFARDLIL